MKVLVTLLLVVLAIAFLPEQAEAANISTCFRQCNRMRVHPRRKVIVQEGANGFNQFLAQTHSTAWTFTRYTAVLLWPLHIIVHFCLNDYLIKVISILFIFQLSLDAVPPVSSNSLFL